MIVLIFYGAFILVQHPKAQIHLGDLGVNGSVENPESAADHGLVILEGIPGERETGGDIAIESVQWEILRVDFVAEPVVQGEIGGDLPGVLQHRLP